MPAQLPEPGPVFLDHVAHFVPAMEPAAAALAGCGFRLTPFTAQTNRVKGKPVAAGMGNRCAMLRRGYVEILAATGDAPLARQLADRLTRHVGLHLAAFSCADAGREHRRLADAGFPVLPLVDMRRPVTTENGKEDARFTITRIAPGVMAEGRTQFLTHHTEKLVWPERHLDHPNGALALLALWIAAADPDEPARRFRNSPAGRRGASGKLRRSHLTAGCCGLLLPSICSVNSGSHRARRCRISLLMKSRSPVSAARANCSPTPALPCGRSTTASP
jgi:Glyoxalase-like domain